MADKADTACLIAKVEPEDLEQIQEYTKEFGVPTHVTDIYKIRSGSYKGVRIWSKMNLGTGRKDDLFLTDSNNKLFTMEDWALYKTSDETIIYSIEDVIEQEKQKVAM